MADVPINPKVLAWALEQSDAKPAQLAAATKRPVATVDEWLAGETQPNMTDVGAMARFLGRSPQFFLLPRVPDLASSPVNRRASQVDTSDASPRESIAVRSIARLQNISRWSADALGAAPVALPKVGSSRPDQYAETVRKWLKWDVKKQTKAPSKARVFRELRAAVEDRGVLVFLQKIGEANSRGFSLPDTHVPAILVNADSKLGSVRSYTLLHELAHLGRGDAVLHHEQDTAAERWCEAFAAAFLLPADDLRAYLSKGVAAKSAPDSLHRVRLVSNRYGASWQSVAYRLVELKLAPQSLIAKVLEGEEPKEGGFGSPDGGGRTAVDIRLDEFGSEFPRLIVSALSEQNISPLDARKYLRVSAAQLLDIAAHVGVSA